MNQPTSARKPYLVIFDLDGLLVDSEPLHCRAYLDVFHRHGIRMDEEEYYLKLSTRGTPIQKICDEYGVSVEPQSLVDEKAVIFLRLIDEELQPIPGAIETLDSLRQHFETALASASRRIFIDRVVSKFDLAHRFRVIATSTESGRRKPHPDIFLYTADKAGYPPSDCLVIEDSEKGVLAAHAAGMKSIAIPTRYTGRGDFTRATRIVASITEVTPGLVREMLGTTREPGAPDPLKPEGCP